VDSNPYAGGATAGEVTKVNNSRARFIGAQAGYNFHYNVFVYGLEAQFARASINGDQLLTGSRSGTRLGLSDVNLGDVSLRAGVALDNFLFFSKFGVAYTTDPTTFSTVSGSFSSRNFGVAYTTDPTTFSTVSGSFSSRNAPGSKYGFTLGAGAEYKLNSSISLKVEYQRFKFANLNSVVFNASQVPYYFQQNMSASIVKAGFNFWLN
jgi:opacity protein-like surface antigen